MSDEGAREFLEHLAQNLDLQKRISSEVTDRATAVALMTHLATEAGFEVDASSMERVLGELAVAASGGEELDDSELEQVAGGASFAKYGGIDGKFMQNVVTRTHAKWIDVLFWKGE